MEEGEVEYRRLEGILTVCGVGFMFPVSQMPD